MREALKIDKYGILSEMSPIWRLQHLLRCSTARRAGQVGSIEFISHGPFDTVDVFHSELSFKPFTYSKVRKDRN